MYQAFCAEMVYLTYYLFITIKCLFSLDIAVGWGVGDYKPLSKQLHLLAVYYEAREDSFVWFLIFNTEKPACLEEKSNCNDEWITSEKEIYR